MDQATALQFVVALVGGGGVSGAITQLISLKREKKWRAAMQIRISKLEDASPDALLERFQQAENFRAADRRDTANQIERLRAVMRETLEELGRIQTRLNMPAL